MSILIISKTYGSNSDLDRLINSLSLCIIPGMKGVIMRYKLTTINLDYLYKTKEKKKTWRAVGILEKSANYGFPKKGLLTQCPRGKKTKQNLPAPKVAKWYAGDGLDHPSVFWAKTLASYLVAGSKSEKLHFPFQIILLSLWAGTVKISQSPSSFLQLSSNSLIGV